MPPESARKIANASARSGSALPRLEPAVGLVDDVDASAPPHDLAVLVALLQCLQRTNDLHRIHPGPEAPASTRPLRPLSTCGWPPGGPPCPRRRHEMSCFVMKCRDPPLLLPSPPAPFAARIAPARMRFVRLTAQADRTPDERLPSVSNTVLHSFRRPELKKGGPGSRLSMCIIARFPPCQVFGSGGPRRSRALSFRTRSLRGQRRGGSRGRAGLCRPQGDLRSRGRGGQAAI